MAHAVVVMTMVDLNVIMLLWMVQLLTCLVACLVVDRQSLGTWRQVYVVHIPQSRCVLSERYR